MRICKTSENLSIVIDSLMFVTFVTPDVECTARTLLECINNVKPKLDIGKGMEEMEKL